MKLLFYSDDEKNRDEDRDWYKFQIKLHEEDMKTELLHYKYSNGFLCGNRCKNKLDIDYKV